ncbi:MAG: DUF4401 domain-containing protein [Lentisphaerae bacterium]|nr:DUF4401 domain-containing protein [Lentisphaerota bacterium]
MTTVTPYLRRHVLPRLLALLFSVLASFGAGDSQAVIRSAIFFVFLTEFFLWTNYLQREKPLSTPQILLAALLWGCLGNAAALPWVTSFAYLTLWPWYVLSGGIYHLLFYSAYLYARRRQLHKAPLFLLLMLAGSLGYLFISAPFITKPAHVLEIALASVNCVIMVAAFLVLLMTRLNPQHWTPSGKARLRYVLLTLAVIASTWFSAYAYYFSYHRAEFSFWLRYASSAEAVQNLHGRLRIDTGTEIDQGYKTILIDFKPGKKPCLTINDKTVQSHYRTAPIISPDGKYVAMSGKDDNGNVGYLHIRRQDGDKNLLARRIQFIDRRNNIFWRPDSRTLCLRDRNTWHILTIQEDDSVTVQVTDYSYMTQLPPDQDLLFVQDKVVWQQTSDSAPERLREPSIVESSHYRNEMTIDAMAMTPDRRHLLVLYNRHSDFPEYRCILATTDLATQKTHLLGIPHCISAPQFTWEEPAHDP